MEEELTKEQELKLWRKILGLRPTVDEVFQHLKKFPLEKQLIRFKVIFKLLDNKEEFKESLIVKGQPDSIELGRWALVNEDQIFLADKRSKWIVKAGFGEMILAQVFSNEGGD